MSPTKPPRPCSVPGCPETSTKGQCPAHTKKRFRDADLRRGKTNDRGYGQAWRVTRLRILERDEYTCRRPGCYRVANEVDHVVSKEDARALGWSEERIEADANLQALCSTCHGDKTTKERIRQRGRR